MRRALLNVVFAVTLARACSVCWAAGQDLPADENAGVAIVDE